MTASDDAGYDVLSGGTDRDGARRATGRRPIGRAVGIGSLAAALLAGGGIYASARHSADSGGPETVLPGSTFAFAKVDLEPGGDQGSAVGEFARRFPSARAQSADALRERAVSQLTAGLHLDYATGVKPWLGRHVAIASFPGTDGRPQVVVALETSDPVAATSALGKLADPPAVAARGSYVVVAKTQQTLDAAVAAAAAEPLAKHAEFVADVAKLAGAQVAISWIDNRRAVDALLHDSESAAAGVSPAGGDPFTKQIRAASVGRTVTGLSAHSTYAEIVGYTVGRSGVVTAAADVLPKLPDTTIGAAFIANGDSLITGSGGGPFAGLGIAGQLPLGGGVSSLMFALVPGGGMMRGASTVTCTAVAAPLGDSTTAEPAPPPVCHTFGVGTPAPGSEQLPDQSAYVDPRETLVKEFGGAVGSGTIVLGSLPVPHAKTAPEAAVIATVKDAARADALATRAKTQFARAYTGTPFSRVDGGVLTLASDAKYAAALTTGGLGQTELFKTAMGQLSGPLEVAVFVNLEAVRDVVPGYPKEWLPVSAIGMSSSQQGDDTVVRVRLVSR